MKHVSLVLLTLILLSGCGPILGQMSKMTEGVEQPVTVKGDLASLAGRRILVVGPFEKGEHGFYICRGEDAAAFAEGLGGDIILADQRSTSADLATDLALASPEILAGYGIKTSPDLLMTGIIEKRTTHVAPLRGVVMGVTYRLLFTDRQSGTQTEVVVSGKGLFEEVIPMIATSLKGAIASR